MNSSYNSRSTKPLYRITQIVWSILIFIQALLAFRFVLKIMGANPEAGFTNFIYTITWPFASPFLAVFSETTIQGGIFEWTTLLAMFVYWLIAIGIIRILLMGKTVSTPEAADKLNEEEE